ncbi:hypothetical protein OG818_40165 [Streptomyces virginiae]|uniref:hypothetical protein n=1 Tax=Streptomyces virginiae TaxID=1961 RepID=UPI0022541E6C|nr:hypothetical protein [Streptomyces virginiae]MCX4721914.1 hypothetical protein [Streptomyces virginiae]
MVLDLLLIGLAITLIPLSIMAFVLVLYAPHYRFRGSAMGPPAFGSGMTSPLLRLMIRVVVSPGPEASTDR